MKIVGLTGGIGSGKSTVAGFFKSLGVPVYVADDEAKKLMQSQVISEKIKGLFGDLAYAEGLLNREYIAKLVFNDDSLLTQLNKIVHPAVRQHFKEWVEKQDTSYIIQEVAILFENGLEKNCDLTILVTAPLEERIRRVLQRDKTTVEDILSRMKKQWPDRKKLELADFVIHNVDLSNTEKEVRKIHVKILGSPVNR